MNELNKYNEKAFENIKHIDESEYKYWLARELMNILQYRNRKNC
jgi:DNA-damage-inducible protein D